MDPAPWIAFVGTVIVMEIPPGPDSMLVVARGIGQGPVVALFTVLG
jgi:threonine/homoserine/homoserine lactone efflux protein